MFGKKRQLPRFSSEWFDICMSNDQLDFGFCQTGPWLACLFLWRGLRLDSGAKDWGDIGKLAWAQCSCAHRCLCCRGQHRLEMQSWCTNLGSPWLIHVYHNVSGWPRYESGIDWKMLKVPVDEMGNAQKLKTRNTVRRALSSFFPKSWQGLNFKKGFHQCHNAATALS